MGEFPRRGYVQPRDVKSTHRTSTSKARSELHMPCIARMASLEETIRSLEGKTQALEQSLTNYASENDLLKRRLFGTKSERSGTSELQLSLGDMLSSDAELQKQLDAQTATPDDASEPNGASEPEAGGPGGRPDAKPRAKPKGRRDLSLSSLPKVTVDIRDADLEARGKVIDWEVSRQLMYRRGGFRVLVRRVAKYAVEVHGKKTILSAPTPRTLFRRGMLHTSLLAWLAVEKFALGVPNYRLEKHIAQEVSLDRGTMCRNLEEVGSTLDATVVHAMFRDAIEGCSVLSTDATGALIQPRKLAAGSPKRPCARRGTSSRSSPTAITCSSRISSDIRKMRWRLCSRAFEACSSRMRAASTTSSNGDLPTSSTTTSSSSDVSLTRGATSSKLRSANTRSASKASCGCARSTRQTPSSILFHRRIASAIA